MSRRVGALQISIIVIIKVQRTRIYTLDRTVKFMGPRYTELTEGKVQWPRIYTLDRTVKFMGPMAKDMQIT